MQKIIQFLIEMNDSNILNEKEKVVTTQEDVVKEVTVETSTEQNVTQEENNVEVSEVSTENGTETLVDVDTKESNNDSSVSNESGPQEDDDTEVIEEVSDDPKDDNIELLRMDKDFIYDIMSVPTHSKLEFRMVSYIILWARRNNILYEFDTFGNIYLTKGELDEGEYYPCVTSHLDTVQDRQDPYIYAGVRLDLKVERTKDKSHKLSVDSVGGAPIGIGADDKGGICICLSMFEHLDKLKACFFLDEETGCHGSDNLDKDWFNDVSYVIGFDSPELFRAAWKCSGVKLFSGNFYKEYMKETCEQWGYKECFYSEPYTDVKNIREKTELICMNFGNGGYEAHSQSEYTIIEDMDYACAFGIDLINKIDNTKRHTLKHKSAWDTTTSWVRGKNGIYEKKEDENDETFLEFLGDCKRRNYYSSYNRTSSSTTNTTTRTVSKDEEIKFETVKYIVNRYDTYISNLKEEILEEIRNTSEKMGIDSSLLEEAISEKFNNEIKF